MKRKIKTLSVMTLGMLAGALVSSCSLDTEPVRGGSGSMLVKAPNSVAYSGSGDERAYWTGTRSSFPNRNEWGNEPAAVTPEEAAYVASWFEENPGYTSQGWDFTDFYVQHVYMRPGNKEGMWHRYDQNRPNNIPGASAYWDEEFQDYGMMDKLLCGSSRESMEEVYNFNATSGSVMRMEDSSALQWGYHSTWGTENDGYFYLFRAAVIDVPGIGPGYYVGLSYYAKKYDNGDKELGIQRVEYCDDWIIKITPDNASLPPVDGGNGSDGDLCQRTDCEHPTHDANGCDICFAENRDNMCAHLYGEWLASQLPGGGDDDDKDDEDDENPSVGDIVKKGLDEVEINLALDEKKDRLLESHLSLHVRTATDVEIFIPVPVQYYCAADDMAIVLDKKVEFAHGGPYLTEYMVGDNPVTLTVTFDTDGIRITTGGITQEVIDYCWERYRDGITFEIWNYFNDPDTGDQLLSYSELKEYLDKSTVRFLGKTPKKYINAFGRDNGKYDSDNPDGRDFHVVPEDESLFGSMTEGPHLNGSDRNEIYSN